MKKWFKALGNAAVNAVVGYMAPMAFAWANGAVTGQPVNMPPASTLGSIAAGAAILGVLNYLKRNPDQVEGK